MRPFDGTKNDTGWITLPLESGITDSAELPQYRRNGKAVYLRGRLVRSGGASWVVGTTAVATLPSGFRPSALTMWALSGSSATSSQGRFWVTTAGVVNVSPVASTIDALSVACQFLID